MAPATMGTYTIFFVCLFVVFLNELKVLQDLGPSFPVFTFMTGIKILKTTSLLKISIQWLRCFEQEQFKHYVVFLPGFFGIIDIVTGTKLQEQNNLNQ